MSLVVLRYSILHLHYIESFSRHFYPKRRTREMNECIYQNSPLGGSSNALLWVQLIFLYACRLIHSNQINGVIYIPTRNRNGKLQRDMCHCIPLLLNLLLSNHYSPWSFHVLQMCEAHTNVSTMSNNEQSVMAIITWIRYYPCVFKTYVPKTSRLADREYSNNMRPVNMV